MPGRLRRFFRAKGSGSRIFAAVKGTEIEPGTFINDSGKEAGVPHHYFDEAGIRELFTGWRFLILSEQVNNYIETEAEFIRPIRSPIPSGTSLCKRFKL